MSFSLSRQSPRAAEAQSGPPSETPPFGFCDGVSNGSVYGWAWRPDAPDQTVEIEVLLDGVVVGRDRADRNRPDLQAAGIGHGRYGWSVRLAPHAGRPAPVTIVARLKDGAALQKGEFTIDPARLRPDDGEDLELAMRPPPRILERRVACIGHSHIGAIAGGARDFGADWDIISFWHDPGAVMRDGAMYALSAESRRRLAAADLVIAAVGGSAHALIGMVEQPEPFDFVLPSAPDLPVDPTRRLVPAEGVRAALAAIFAEHELLLAQTIEAAGGAPVIQIEPPPPTANEARLTELVPWSLYPDHPRQVAPLWVRYKTWRLSCEVIEASCKRLGAAYHRVPKDVTDREGFLRSGLDFDAIHGGVEYGRRMIHSLDVWLD